MRKIMIATALVAALFLVSSAHAAPATRTEGTFAPVPGFADYGITGTAQLIRTSNSTIVNVHLEGLEPGQTYPAHLHNGPCASGGGGHYQDVVGGASAPPNELWLASGSNDFGITANAAGRASGHARATWVARPEAQSIVVHYYANSSIRVACAQLN